MVNSGTCIKKFVPCKAIYMVCSWFKPYNTSQNQDRNWNRDTHIYKNVYHVRPFTQFVPGLNHVIPVKIRYPGLKTRTRTGTGYTDINIKLNHAKFIYMVHIYRYHNSGILSPGYYTILDGIFVLVSILPLINIYFRIYIILPKSEIAWVILKLCL